MANSNDSFIHVKLSYSEVAQSKKELLASEMDVLNIMKTVGRYIFLRQKEMEFKAQFYREIKKMAVSLKLLETSLPHVKVPQILLPPVERQMTEKKSTAMPSGMDNENLEQQLMDIQRRLRAIS